MDVAIGSVSTMLAGIRYPKKCTSTTDDCRRVIVRHHMQYERPPYAFTADAGP